MTITTGGAHSANGRTQPGDQYQEGVPDYKGEVSLREYADERSFANRYGSFTIVRPVDSQVAASMASLMITACNNRHIGYLYGGKGMICQGGDNGVNTGNDCVTDCSGLVCECVSEAISTNVYAATSGMIATLTGTGRFIKIGLFQSYDATPVYNGDILVKPGSHTDMVVQGNPREGTSDEVLDETGTIPTTSGPTIIKDGSTAEKSFSPRRYAPDSVQSTYKYFDQSYGSTENGSYAWGRFSEIMEQKCKLSKGEPRRWYITPEDGYRRGVSPALGAVMCFTNAYDASDPGYVCIVEDISDNYIYISHFTLGKKPRFEFLKRSKSNDSWNLDLDKDGVKEYVFQGFIYSPAIGTSYAAGSATSAGKKSYIQTFIDTARGQVGEGIDFVLANGGISNAKQAWSGAFIRAVAARAGGVLNVIIPDTISCSSIGTVGVASNMGQWIDGPALGGRPNPQIGDIALFRTGTNSYRTQYGADKAGIVVSIETSGVSLKTGELRYDMKIVIGDCEGKIKAKNYTNLTPSLSGLFRPYWDRVDSIAVAPQTLTAVYGMYTEGTSVEDACIRDIKYLASSNKGYKPSIKSTGIKLCAINYTGMLANMYGLFAEMTEYMQRREDPESYIRMVSNSSESDVDMDSVEIGAAGQIGSGDMTISQGQIAYVIKDLYNPSRTVNKVVVADNTFKIIYTTLKDFFGNSAGAIAAMGSIEIESGHDTSAGDAAGAVGLCQWMGGRRTAMIARCLSYNGQPWENNLEGQLTYMMEELNTSYYSKARDACMNCPETIEGAYEASDTFMKIYEGPAHQDINGPNRRIASLAVWTLIKGARK